MASFRDLRQHVDCAGEVGEFKTVRGADWSLEIGGTIEYAQRRRNGPAVLFDGLPGYPAGHLVIVNPTGSANRPYEWKDRLPPNAEMIPAPRATIATERGDLARAPGNGTMTKSDNGRT